MRIKINSAEKWVLALTAVGVALALITIIFLQDTEFFQSMLITSIILAGLPFTVTQYLSYRKAKEIEQNLPDFLRDVAESNHSGMPLSKAIENATYGSYGALSAEMKLVSSQISWGVPFEETLRRFAERVKSKLVRQAILIIIETHNSGGEIADILETVSTDIKTLKRIEMERKSKLRIYLVSMYFIFFLFLGIIAALQTTFVPATPQLNDAAGLLGGTPSNLSEEDFKQFFFHLCLIQAFFAGLIGGQMGEGSVISGFKHSIVLILVTLLVFQFFLASPELVDKVSDSITRIPITTMSVQSVRTAFTVFKSTSSNDVVEAVKEKALEKKLKGYDLMVPSDVTFAASSCAPCERGDVVVSSNAVIVNKQSKITYSVIGLGGGKYRITIGGA